MFPLNDLVWTLQNHPQKETHSVSISSQLSWNRLINMTSNVYQQAFTATGIADVIQDDCSCTGYDLKRNLI